MTHKQSRVVAKSGKLAAVAILVEQVENPVDLAVKIEQRATRRVISGYPAAVWGQISIDHAVSSFVH